MGLGGCCTFHVQLSGTMEGKNASSVRSPPHPASLSLTGIPETKFSEGCDSEGERPIASFCPPSTCLQIHHYSFITSFIRLFIPQMFPEHICTLGQPMLWAKN